MCSPPVIEAHALGKMYKLFRRPVDRVLDAFGVPWLRFWDRRPHEPFWALRNVSFEVPRGERFGIIGRNGAGKSTLLKIIAGNLAATEGRITVRGGVQALLELGTGFHPDFTGRQNVRASLAYYGHAPAVIREKEQEIIAFTELDEFIDQPIRTYSAGMYARLGFSTATALEPEVLIIDEVLGAGDAYFTAKCVERMERITRESGATVVFVSHDLAAVQRLCRRVLWLDRGGIVADGEPTEVVKAYYLATLEQEERRRRAESGERVDRARVEAFDGRSDRRGSMHARFERVVPIDADGAERYVFEKGQPFGFQVDADVTSPIERSFFGVTLYGSDGTVVCQTIRPLRNGLAPGRCRWSLLFPQPNLRQGDYVCSFALHGECDQTQPVMADAYAHWSRVLSIRIDEAYLGQTPLGVVELATDPSDAHPVEVTYR